MAPDSMIVLLNDTTTCLTSWQLERQQTLLPSHQPPLLFQSIHASWNSSGSEARWICHMGCLHCSPHQDFMGEVFHLRA